MQTKSAAWCWSAGGALILTVISFGLAEAQTPVEQAATKLAGKTSLAWRYQQAGQIMGADESCTGDGETDRFFANQKLQITKCTAGKFTRTDHTWSLSQSGSLDIILKIDSTESLLLFRDDGSAHYMRLRHRSDSKTIPTEDRDFRLSDD